MGLDTSGANLCAGSWSSNSNSTKTIIDPLTGDPLFTYPDLGSDEIQPFVDHQLSCSKTGLHNPHKNVERYLQLGNMCHAVATELQKPDVEDFFTALIQRCVPKSEAQCRSEVAATRQWFASYGGDGVRNLSKSSALPGDHAGQETRSYRYPYGPVGVITPFNFPLEIPALQATSAVFMGNQPIVKVDEKVAIVFEQFLRLMHHSGMPKDTMNHIYCSGPVANDLLVRFDSRMLLFTGSQSVAEKLCRDLRGRVKLEDAGFDWKIMGPDVAEEDYVAWQCDQDAYAFSGQKCSAQSIVFMHENWVQAGFIDRLAEYASRRKFEDLTMGPILSWTNERIQAHVEQLLAIPGSKILFGGHSGKIGAAKSIPDCYGCYEPTAIFVPFQEAMKEEHFGTVTHELFGPVQVITEYADDQLQIVLDACERMNDHLSAAIVSNNPNFINTCMASTINGTTYAGIRARTTGAPVQHWFGPAGDPRAGGIHTIEAIQQTWSCHREIIMDGIVPSGWSRPKAT
jgi:1-pyrroline-5-carboxylate dehydrogenase